MFGEEIINAAQTTRALTLALDGICVKCLFASFRRCVDPVMSVDLMLEGHFAA